MVTMYSLCFVKQNCHSTVLQSINWHNVMCCTSNGGRIYEHVIKQVLVGLIPLKLHPERFWKKGNLVKIKRNHLKWNIFQVILCSKNDLPGRKEAMFELRSKMKRYWPPGKWFDRPTPLPSGISWVSDPPSPWNFQFPPLWELGYFPEPHIASLAYWVSTQ